MSREIFLKHGKRFSYYSRIKELIPFCNHSLTDREHGRDGARPSMRCNAMELHLEGHALS